MKTRGNLRWRRFTGIQKAGTSSRLTREAGRVISTSGPLFGAGFDPAGLDYDDYFNTEIQTKLKDFRRISKDEYLELLRKNGFYPQITQRYLY
ncbi:MAG: hypothetical protein L0Y36_07795 [Planctomycetales bacterium]|nr:hypothetical protein [Planctomycetales bacterium]